MTPLHLAVASGRIKVVKYLVEQEEADINIQDENGVIMTLCYTSAGMQNS